jgi:RNA polymerase sigma factor (sigma-70 family)
MEVSALKYSGGMGLHGRMPLLRLQSDERLIAFIRRGNGGAFEALVARYETRLLAFCRHLLGSREDAEDVLQEVMTAAFNAIVADERAINVRPWLYRIARNRSLNHLRKIRAVGVDSMDTHFSDNGASTADKVHEREAFRMLVGDIHELPETQKTALVLREMDALTYEQIAEAMETTVPSVKSLLVRARVSLAEAAEARLLSCAEVRIELGEIAEGLRRRPTPLVRRHLRACKRCATFRTELKRTNKALAALMPVGPLMVLKKLAILHLGHSAGSGAAGAGSGATAAGSGVAAVGSGAAGASAAGSFAVAGSTSGFVSAGMSAIAAKAAAGLAAAALVTASAVGIDHSDHRRVHHQAVAVASAPAAAAPREAAPATTRIHREPTSAVRVSRRRRPKDTAKATFVAATVPSKTVPPPSPAKPTTTTPPGRTSTQSDPTVLPPAAATPAAPPTASAPVTAPAPSATGSVPPSTDPTSTSQASPPPPAPPTPASPAPTSGTPPAPTNGTPPTSTGPTPPPSGGGSGGTGGTGGTGDGSGASGGTGDGTPPVDGTPPDLPAPPSGAPPALAP